ncbi:S49 family peptidase, partial [Salmonella enterica]|nr:S49 family peptidase [Salmonella enterica]EGK2314630.1 S49 family peptidase [Salmonella enterica]
LAAAPRAGATSLSDSILALDEAKGREALAGKLATTPGMTVEQARELLAAAPDTSGSGGVSMNNAFDQFMQLHSPASLSGSGGNSNDADADTQLLMSIPGTMATKGEDRL